MEEVISPREDVVHACAADLDQQGSGHAIARRHSGEYEGFLDVIGVALPGRDAGRLLGRVIQQPAHLLCVQSCRATGGRGRSECARDAVRALVALIHSDATAHHHGDARPDVVTQRYRA